ncbi:MAG: hypothetical protein LLF97_10990 [Planctomycetaceae bacterium]|nr:hypothetical protein [Planctomycetaceae bacterium]
MPPALPDRKPDSPRRWLPVWLTGWILHESHAWLISLIAHLAALLLFALVITTGKSTGDGPTFSVEVADSGDSLDPGGSSSSVEFHAAAGQETAATTDLAPVAPTTDAVAVADKALDPRQLAAQDASPGETGGEDAGKAAVPGSGNAGLGTGTGSGIGPGKGRGQATLFNAKSEGNKFVYVLDRSASMSAHNLLQLAKTELMASIDKLKQNCEFQVIFYNEEPFIFNPHRGADKFILATTYNKKRVQRFVDSVYPFDGTDHMRALFRAIRMRPDAIFLWTDANEPKLGPIELENIANEANGVVINTIEVGYGPEPPDNNNFLVLLARQNHGQHVYLDINKIAPPDF